MNTETYATTISIDNREFTITVFQQDDGKWAPEVHDAEGLVYVGGEDDEDDPTPEMALEHGERLLREQSERGNL